MSQLKDKSTNKPRRTDSRDQLDDGLSDMAGWGRTLRETVESVVIAFVLAFLFRTFEAEAFVIPTGSMAPTLNGRHLDVKCDKCQYRFAVGAKSEEAEEMAKNPNNRQFGDIAFCICPNCRYQLELTNPDKRKEFPTYNGDRILVSKFSFDFKPPDRWNVIVFKFPEDSKTNYIKRLIGLPGEVVRIRDGDIAVSPDGGKNFPPELTHRDFPKLRAMMQVVYDNDYAYQPFLDSGWPERWKKEAEPGGAAWTVSMKKSPDRADPVYTTTGKSADGRSPAEAWLRYYNYVPDLEDWANFGMGRKIGGPNTRAQPISDFIAYDVGSADMIHRGSAIEDLAVECQADVTAAEGQIKLELVKRGEKFGCTLDIAHGTAELDIPGLNPDQRPKAGEGCISGAGSYRIFFANVDHELTLAINDRNVSFDKPKIYDLPPKDDTQEAIEDAKRYPGPNAGIGSSGAAVQMSRLRLLRDVYYTYEADNPQHAATPRPQYDDRAAAARDWPRNKSDWVCYPTEAAKELLAAGADVRYHDQFYFVGKEGDPSPAGSRSPKLLEDQFFPLGDNSPLSADGRYWHFVDRRLLIGKALLVHLLAARAGQNSRHQCSVSVWDVSEFPGDGVRAVAVQ